MEGLNDDKNLEIYIANLLIDDVRWYDDVIWQKNVEYARKLLEEKKPIEKLKNFELHALIAYAGLWLIDCEVEDAQTAKMWEEMRHTFWFAVFCLSTNRLKHMDGGKAKV